VGYSGVVVFAPLSNATKGFLWPIFADINRMDQGLRRWKRCRLIFDLWLMRHYLRSQSTWNMPRRNKISARKVL